MENIHYILKTNYFKVSLLFVHVYAKSTKSVPTVVYGSLFPLINRYFKGMFIILSCVLLNPCINTNEHSFWDRYLLRHHVEYYIHP